MCDVSGLPPDEVFARLRDAGPRLDAGHRGRGAARRRARAHQPEQAAGRALGRDHRGLPPRRPALDLTVMFGHIEEPWELAEHMRVVRELQERTGGITEFVPLSFIPFHTLLGRTHGVEEISREENLKHTAVFRLALGRTIPNLQASWVKMGLDAATEALRWGVNDLGGTLMEESISRLAGSYHGVRLDPRRARRRRAPRRPPGGRAHDALRAARATSCRRRRSPTASRVAAVERLGCPTPNPAITPEGLAALRAEIAELEGRGRARDGRRASRPRASWATSRRTPSTTSPRTTRRTSRRGSSACAGGCAPRASSRRTSDPTSSASGRPCASSTRRRAADDVHARRPDRGRPQDRPPVGGVARRARADGRPRRRHVSVADARRRAPLPRRARRLTSGSARVGGGPPTPDDLTGSRSRSSSPLASARRVLRAGGDRAAADRREAPCPLAVRPRREPSTGGRSQPRSARRSWDRPATERPARRSASRRDADRDVLRSAMTARARSALALAARGGPRC